MVRYVFIFIHSLIGSSRGISQMEYSDRILQLMITVSIDILTFSISSQIIK